MRVSPRASAALRAGTPALIQTAPPADVLDSRFRGNGGVGFRPSERGRPARNALARVTLTLALSHKGRGDPLASFRTWLWVAGVVATLRYSRFLSPSFPAFSPSPFPAFSPVIPAKAGIQRVAIKPAIRNQAQITASVSLLPLWEKVRMRVSPRASAALRAGRPRSSSRPRPPTFWIPAFAGMTGKGSGNDGERESVNDGGEGADN